MKIAFIDNNQYSVYPPDNAIDAGLYMMARLADGMIKKGHEVTIFAPKLHNINPKKIISSKLNPFFEDFSLDYWANSDKWDKSTSLMIYDIDLYLTLLSYLSANSDIDILHIHTSPFIAALPFLARIDLPKIFTLHTTQNEFRDQLFLNFLKQYPALANTSFVSISNNQVKDSLLKKSMPFFTIQHGIEVDKYTFGKDGSENIIFLSRINPDKGPQIAIRVAKELGKKIALKGRVSTDNPSFFNSEIKPFVDGTMVTFDGSVNTANVSTFYQHGRLFLFPIQWEEPFGLVMIESMACGTPVVTYARGSAPEIVEDGKTGFLVNSSDDNIRGDWIIKKTGIEGLKEATERIYELSDEQYRQMRENCRMHIEQNFTVEKMVDEYLSVYEKILSSK